MLAAEVYVQFLTHCAWRRVLCIISISDSSIVLYCTKYSTNINVWPGAAGDINYCTHINDHYQHRPAGTGSGTGRSLVVVVARSKSVPLREIPTLEAPEDGVRAVSPTQRGFCAVRRAYHLQ